MDLRGKKSFLVYCYSNLPNFSIHENILCWLLQPLRIRLRKVKFLIKFVFPYLRICSEFSKCLCKVSLNRKMLKCIIFILAPSKVTLACRHISLSHVTQIYSSTQTCSVHTQTFSFYCHSSHWFTCPNRHFLLSAGAYVGQTIHTGVFLSLFLPHSSHRLTYLHTQTFTFLCRGLNKPTHLRGHFLFIDIAHFLI